MYIYIGLHIDVQYSADALRHMKQGTCTYNHVSCVLPWTDLRVLPVLLSAAERCLPTATPTGLSSFLSLSATAADVAAADAFDLLLDFLLDEFLVRSTPASNEEEYVTDFSIGYT